MDSTTRNRFRKSALASGLLTVEQFEEAEMALRADGADAENGDLLIAKLIEQGRINTFQAEQFKVGQTHFNLGPYQVIDSLGQGGMGQVFKAEHTLMGRVVAIKVLPKHKSTPEAIASFTREMRAQAQLDHQNLVRAFDAGRDRNVYYLATEYVPGTDLRKFVRTRTRLSMQEAATIISQAAEGLAHAHSRGMIHRDVKPGNLLVTPSGHTKVSDLGLAGFAGNEDDDDPRAGKVVGTADYLSPEQIRAPRSVTPAADIYALGCTLYYAVTGKVPFPGGTSKEKALRHLEEPPLNPQRINPELSDEFVEVLSDVMEKDPKQRIQTCAEVVRRLARWAGDAVETTAEEVSASLGAGGVLARPAIRSQESDTRSGFFDDLDSNPDTPSQISAGGSSGNQDTLDDLAGLPQPKPDPAPPIVTLLAFGAPLLAAALLLLSLVLKLVR